MPLLRQAALTYCPHTTAVNDLPHEPWVIWNGRAGLLATAALGRIETMPHGARMAWLAPPFDMVGPFNLDDLETQGRIHFEACTVMSRARWQADQADLRQTAFEQRRAAQERLHGQHQRAQSLRDTARHESAHREALGLPKDGPLTPKVIKAAYRRRAQKAHPDAGGHHQAFIEITEARRALLARFG